MGSTSTAQSGADYAGYQRDSPVGTAALREVARQIIAPYAPAIQAPVDDMLMTVAAASGAANGVDAIPATWHGHLNQRDEINALIERQSMKAGQ